MSNNVETSDKVHNISPKNDSTRSSLPLTPSTSTGAINSETSIRKLTTNFQQIRVHGKLIVFISILKSLKG